MTERRVSECRECGAPMRWVTTEKGKNMPVDDEPNSAGKFVIDDPEADPPKVRYIGNSEYTGERFTSHFETCSNPRRFSRKAKRRS